ncbi:MAG: hypothetical protein EAZ42_00790, partial [Verrucomicrobia bacterium]
TTLISTTKAIIMTSLQKILATSAIVIFAGAAIYQTRQVHQLESELAAYKNDRKQTQRPDGSDSRQSSGGNENSPPHFRTAVRERSPKDSTKSAFSAWLDRVDMLKARLELTEGASIPEMQWLTENDWIDAAKNDLTSDEDYRRAFSALRGTAEKKFSSLMYLALQKYLNGNGGVFPKRMEELQAFFETPVEAAVLDRWHIIPDFKSPMQLVGEWTITQKATVDAELDTLIGVSANGNSSFSPPNPNAEALMLIHKAFSDANPGKRPLSMSELLPYATTPQQKEALNKIISQK